jgi:mannose-6-phosphate isomerase-like protein (cupin superfamily)
MKDVEIKSEGTNYSAIDIGDFNNLTDYKYLHPKLNQYIDNKVFIGEILKTTGVEISFQILPPNTEMAFIHKHKNHEEIYIFISGMGQFKVDNEQFDVKEGSIIRISPNGERTWRNNSTNPLIFMVIQSQEGSLTNHFIADGMRVNKEISWKI